MTETDRTDACLEDIPADWLEEFEATARRPLPLRFRYVFIRTYKPLADDELCSEPSKQQPTIAAGAKKTDPTG